MYKRENLQLFHNFSQEEKNKNIIYRIQNGKNGTCIECKWKDVCGNWNTYGYSNEKNIQNKTEKK